ncbi:CsbD family protein [Acetobacterium sp.]|uniref:CsbD family protein n=1 Tax=Acetobacterium sp. TaxID=1872094 RepID=UPI002F3E3274
MNKDIFEGKWEQFKGEVQKRWGKLTNDDLDVVKGDVRILVGQLQEKYGMTKEAAEKAIEDLKEQHTNKEMFEEKWEQFKTEVQKRWDKLTNEDLDAVKGNVKVLVEKLQEKYGMTKEAAEKAINDIKEKMKK